MCTPKFVTSLILFFHLTEICFLLSTELHNLVAQCVEYWTISLEYLSKETSFFYIMQTLRPSISYLISTMVFSFGCPIG